MGNSGSSLTPLQTCLNNVCAGRADCVGYPNNNPLFQIQWAKPYNLNTPVTPVAVIRPRSAQEVSAAVKCAAQNNVKVQAKSGGHSYANYGLGGKDGALMIDMVNIQGFSMDTKTWQAKVGAGTRLGDVDKKLHANGARAIAHGVCPGVGIGGHATIGGLGPMSRMWGSCLDHVVEVEVVTADGSILRANEKSNADLFWALKGAGASFGVITEFVVRTHPEPGAVVQYSYSFSFGRQKDMAPVYQKWQDLIADATVDRRFASMFIVQPLGALITTTFYGTDAEYQATGIPKRLPTGGKISKLINDFLGSIARDAENEALALSDIPTPFYSKALAFRKEELLRPSGVNELFNYLDSADKGTLLWFIIFDQSGGAVADVAPDATAYPHRDKILFYQSYAIGIPNVSDKTRNFLTGVHNSIQRNAGGANTTYAGYVDSALVGPTGTQCYWGSNVPKLRRVKKAWDPRDVFHNPSSVQPAA